MYALQGQGLHDVENYAVILQQEDTVGNRPEFYLKWVYEVLADPGNKRKLSETDMDMLSALVNDYDDVFRKLNITRSAEEVSQAADTLSICKSPGRRRLD